MRCIYTSVDRAEVGLLKNMIHKAGISCVVLNEQMAQMLPALPFVAELWVENEADYLAAAVLVEEWHHPAQGTNVPWDCPRCGERMTVHFGKCWNCGTHKSARE